MQSPFTTSMEEPRTTVRKVAHPVPTIIMASEMLTGKWSSTGMDISQLLSRAIRTLCMVNVSREHYQELI